jgi:ribosomal protein S27AE
VTNEAIDVRWQCPTCGRFLANNAIRSWDEINPGAYYGVTGHTVATCTRCGEVNDPRLVEIGTMAL